MKLSVHLDNRTAAALAREARRQGRTRSALVVEAVGLYLARASKSEWPPELLGAEPVAGLEPFERSRRGAVLKPE